MKRSDMRALWQIGQTQHLLFTSNCENCIVSMKPQLNCVSTRMTIEKWMTRWMTWDPITNVSHKKTAQWTGTVVKHYQVLDNGSYQSC